MSGSTYSSSGGTIHRVTDIIVHERYTILDWDVALVQVCCISFSVSIHNAMFITYCCDNQLYLTLLLCKMQFF